MTGRSKEETADITLLGNQKTQYPCVYVPEMLETFENKHQGNDYFVKFNCPEFTSLCPITGQPDFATVTISYVPNIRPLSQSCTFGRICPKGCKLGAHLV